MYARRKLNVPNFIRPKLNGYTREYAIIRDKKKVVPVFKEQKKAVPVADKMLLSKPFP